jgi:hypothetical protein
LTHGFPKADSLDYQAQHTLETETGKSGRYDGLYLSDGYPYVVLEAKRHVHALTDDDFQQARLYATSSFFDKPVPLIVVSNGQVHQFYKLTTTINPADHKPIYAPIPATDWDKIVLEKPGEVKQLLTQAQLLTYLKNFKESSYSDIAALFLDPTTGKFDLGRHSLGTELSQIMEARKNFIGVTAKGDAAVRHAIQAVALHFTIKILFIKLIEDLARGPDTTLQSIRHDLIHIDIRTAIIYGSAADRTNVIGNLYEKLIDDELRSSLGAVYTPDETMAFMVDLGERYLGKFRGHKIVEPACGSGHFYREIYRRYVSEVKAKHPKSPSPPIHAEAVSLCVPKIRFCNIGGEGRRERAVM